MSIPINNNSYKNYFVWVPRYNYRINNSLNNGQKGNEKTEIYFLEGTSNTLTKDGFIIPDAFWWDKNDNGSQDSGEQLTGFWMSKFQLSG